MCGCPQRGDPPTSTPPISLAWRARAGLPEEGACHSEALGHICRAMCHHDENSCGGEEGEEEARAFNLLCGRLRSTETSP